MLNNFNKDDLLFLVPPLIGAALGLRYAQKQTVVSRIIGYAISASMGVYVGAGLGEYWQLGPWATGGAQFTVAAVGMEVVGFVYAALREGIANPAATAGKWLRAILPSWGRSGDIADEQHQGPTFPGETK